jgi:uncharacterized heparinase superfamily protein
VDSSEVWASFRVARRAYPRNLSIHDQTTIVVECAHDGYSRLPGKPVHRRIWELRDGELAIEDRVGGTDLPAVARFHFHPTIRLEIDDCGGIAWRKDSRLLTWAVKSGTPRIEPTTYHPEFGTTVANQCLAVDLKNGCSHVRFTAT